MNKVKVFLPWAVAIFIVLSIELIVYIIYRPSTVERSDFVVYPIKKFFHVPPERWVLFEKLRFFYEKKPTIVHAGDSSSYFGIMPEVAEQYLDGEKILNYGCCVNQGFYGYLVALETALRKYPSLKYIVMYVAPSEIPRPAFWPQGKGTSSVDNLGDVMQKTLIHPIAQLYPPSNSQRCKVIGQIFEFGQGELNSPRGPSCNKAYTQFNVMKDRGGYMIEHDFQNPQGCEFTLYRLPNGRSYYDVIAEEFVSLAKRYKVTPILVFQPTSCAGADNNLEIAQEINLLRKRYPDLKIPFDYFEIWPARFFSVPAHVQKTLAIETSRRFGRVLRDIIRGEDRYTFPLSIDQNEKPVAKIIKATVGPYCNTQAIINEGYSADLTAAFSKVCDGKEHCFYQKGSAEGDIPPPSACRAIYTVNYVCGTGPVRTVRQEQKDSFNGKFEINCRAEEPFAKDSMPYGIQIAHATFVSSEGGTERDAPLQPPLDTPLHHAARNGDFSQAVKLLQEGANVDSIGWGNHTPLHLAAYHGHITLVNLFIAYAGANVNKQASTGYTALKYATMAGHTEICALLKDASTVGYKHGNATMALQAYCDGKIVCDYKVNADIFEEFSLGTPKKLEVEYWCNRNQQTKTVSLEHARPGDILHLSCAQEISMEGTPQINKLDKDGVAFLRRAAYNGDLNKATELLKEGVNVVDGFK